MMYGDIVTNIFAVVFTAFFILGIILNFIRYMHMFQLGSYHASAQIKWLKNNIKYVVPVRVFSILCFILIYFLTESIAGYISAMFFAAAVIVLSKLKKAKKKLVFTPRVIRMCITSAVIYAGIIVVSIIFSVHFLIIAAVFAEFAAITANFINKPIEKAINRYYINDAKRIINELPHLMVFGITGSYGKTSTKYFLNTLLSAEFNVLMTPESYNTTMGVVKTIRSSLNATHEIFICEMGAKGIGEIKEICDIVKPRNSMITSIGPQHLESFKSLENIIKTKFEIADCITDGTIFLNFDNEYIRTHEINKNIIKYGISDENNNYDYRADNISVSGKGTAFFVTMPGGERVSFETGIIGEHNVQNIVGAIAAAHYLGVGTDKLKFAVKRLQSVPHRLQLIGGGDKIIIDDAFNSNPSGAKAALNTLAMLDGYRILVTPGMVELGEKEYELNAELGSHAGDVCDFVVLVGEKRAVPMLDGLRKNKFDEKKIKVTNNLKEALTFVDSINSDGKKKIVLLENDLPDNY